MPFNRPTPQQIVDMLSAELDLALPGADARLRFSVENILVRMLAMCTHLMLGHQDWISRQILVSTAEGDQVALHAQEWGIAALSATPAFGRIRFTGISGSVVPAGTNLVRGDQVMYRLDADAVLAGGSAIGSVTAVVAGAIGNAVAGSKLSLANPIAGVSNDTVVETNGLSGGVDIETTNALRARVLARKQRPPQGGSKADYEQWAKEVSGVTRAWCYPEQLGAGTVVVLFVTDNLSSIIPAPGLIATVADHIDVKRPVTSDVTVAAPTLLPIDFDIKLSPDTAAVRNAVISELQDLFAREAIPGGPLKRSRINEAISAATGEFDHSLIAPAADITTTFGQIAQVGNFTWGSL